MNLNRTTSPKARIITLRVIVKKAKATVVKVTAKVVEKLKVQRVQALRVGVRGVLENTGNHDSVRLCFLAI